MRSFYLIYMSFFKFKSRRFFLRRTESDHTRPWPEQDQTKSILLYAFVYICMHYHAFYAFVYICMHFHAFYAFSCVFLHFAQMFHIFFLMGYTFLLCTISFPILSLNVPIWVGMSHLGDTQGSFWVIGVVDAKKKWATMSVRGLIKLQVRNWMTHI